MHLCRVVVTRIAPYVHPVGAIDPNGFVLNADDDRRQQLKYRSETCERRPLQRAHPELSPGRVDATHH